MNEIRAWRLTVDPPHDTPLPSYASKRLLDALPRAPVVFSSVSHFTGTSPRTGSKRMRSSHPNTTFIGRLARKLPSDY